jgi:type IV pilus biogenesis protein CpaD/CtpE
MSSDRTVPRTAVTALAAAVVLVLVGCAQQQPVDPAAIHRWSKAQEAAVDGDDDVLGVLAADGNAGHAEEPVHGSVAMTFAAPVQIDALEFSCFGKGTMSTSVELESRGTTVSFGAEPMQCGERPQRLRVPAKWRHDVDRVGFGGADSTADSAWQLTIRGSGGTAD